jgi:hypothetical protein
MRHLHLPRPEYPLDVLDHSIERGGSREIVVVGEMRPNFLGRDIGNDGSSRDVTFYVRHHAAERIRDRSRVRRADSVRMLGCG